VPWQRSFSGGFRSAADPLPRQRWVSARRSARRCCGACSRRRAPVSVPLVRFGTKVLVFGSATLALYATDHQTLALVFAFIVVANAALIRLGR
jgi:Protein of unknown function (DUF2568)